MELTELGYYPKKVAKSQPQKPARNRCHASTCSSVRPCCHLSDKNYRFSDNLPHSQALLEDQLSRITWRDIIFLFRGTVSLIYFGSLFCPTPRYAGEAPGYLSNDNFMSRIKSTKQVLRLPGIIFSLRSKSFLRWLASVTCGWTRRRERKYTAIPS